MHIIAIGMLIVYINFIIGCGSYYKVTQVKSIASIESQIEQNSRYFILHHGEKVWHMTNIVLDGDREELSGNLEQLPEYHKSYLTTDTSKTNRIRSGGNRLGQTAEETYHQQKFHSPTYEVHFYISQYMERQDGGIMIPLEAISSIEMYDSDTEQNAVANFGTAVGAVAAVVVIILVVAALTKSSCPFVYVHDGITRHFVGEMFGGAIYPSLERDDYMPLPGFAPVEGEFRVEIANELLERQYTNLAELMVVEHPDSVRVLFDKNGKLQTLSDPKTPALVMAENGVEYTALVCSKDSSAYLFNDDNLSGKEVNSLTMTFEKPLLSTEAKLVINAKNSYWLDYIYGKFNEKFGTWYNTFSENQKSVPSDRIYQWMLDQGIPLSIYIETSEGWEFVDYFQVVGPLASREMVMPLDLSDVSGDKVRVKLECGFMFWEIDYAAIDFSSNIPLSISHVAASSAIDENGQEVSSSLLAVDTNYLVQPDAGNHVNIIYPYQKPVGEQIQSVFLHSRGYYEYIRYYKNIPDYLTLMSFKQAGAFPKFSKREYNAFISKPQLFKETITSSDGY